MSEEKPAKKFSVEKAWGLLKSDFASRTDNIHNNSGVGGDLKKFLFVLFTNVVLVESKNMAPLRFVFDDLGVKLIYYPYHDISVKDLRNHFDHFYNDALENQKEKFPPDITKEQVIDYEYMKQFKGKSFHIDTYLVALKSLKRLSDLLDESVPLREGLLKKSVQEKRALIEDFARDNDVYVDTENNYEELIRIIDKHPVYATKLKDINDRYNANIKSMLGYEEKTILMFLGSLPLYLSVIPFRNVIGIDRLVKYDLDEFLTNALE